MGALREFVYMDEVSVYSLIASRLGPIAAEFTETQTASLQGEATTAVSGSVLAAKGEMSSRVQGANTSSSQILRRATVQATFKELYDLESDALLVRPLGTSCPAPQVSQAADLEALAGKNAEAKWIITPADLRRGALLEVEVELGADALFRLSALASALLEMADDIPEALGVQNLNNLAQVRSVSQLLEKLLSGLVPVRGRAVDYAVMRYRRSEWIVHQRILNQLPSRQRGKAIPLFVVGVAEESLFWKDIRRVLFSDSRFRALCRVARDGIQSSWTPVKLVDVLNQVAPQLGRDLDRASRDAANAMAYARPVESRIAEVEKCARNATHLYARLVAQRYSSPVSDEVLGTSGLPSREHCRAFRSIEGRRAAFRAMTHFLERRLGLEVAPEVAAELRCAALLDSGLFLNGEKIADGQSVPQLTDAPSNERFIDSELVAVYW